MVYSITCANLMESIGLMDNSNSYWVVIGRPIFRDN